MTEFIILKRCVNCNTNNSVNAVECLGCHKLFIKEITFKQWTEMNTELIKRKEIRRKERERIRAFGTSKKREEIRKGWN